MYNSYLCQLIVSVLRIERPAAITQDGEPTGASALEAIALAAIVARGCRRPEAELDSLERPQRCSCQQQCMGGSLLHGGAGLAEPIGTHAATLVLQGDQV
ncbi:hypothetical protein GCM10010170_025020 [Dactylosporangium salmoneum]|uniref:Uncharacterized protein n=1 Tax=Dactylosporangium salmoneum TaxID=53361 RepID=A0ABN3G0A1_9ACTN